MVLTAAGRPLDWCELRDRTPGPNEIRVRVSACGVCRTDLHVVDGELPYPTVPIIAGHEIVGRIDAIGAGAAAMCRVDWLARTDTCRVGAVILTAAIPFCTPC